MAIQWDTGLQTGIKVIDDQHHRIIEYINELEDAKQNNDLALTGEVLKDCVDYTMSHFAFEESLQQEAGYEHYGPHKKVHELFTRKIEEYLERFELGDDITEDLHSLLSRWIINHIKRDDADYVDAVKAHMEQKDINHHKHNKKSWFQRLFGG